MLYNPVLLNRHCAIWYFSAKEPPLVTKSPWNALTFHLPFFEAMPGFNVHRKSSLEAQSEWRRNLETKLRKSSRGDPKPSVIQSIEFEYSHLNLYCISCKSSSSHKAGFPACFRTSLFWKCCSIASVTAASSEVQSYANGKHIDKIHVHSSFF